MIFNLFKLEQIHYSILCNTIVLLSTIIIVLKYDRVWPRNVIITDCRSTGHGTVGKGHKVVIVQALTVQYYINITFPDMVIVENIIPRNVIINRGAAEVDNHISMDDIFDYHHIREGNIYFIIPNKPQNNKQ